jgi:hypothetical protein
VERGGERGARGQAVPVPVPAIAAAAAAAKPRRLAPPRRCPTRPPRSPRARAAGRGGRRTRWPRPRTDGDARKSSAATDFAAAKGGLQAHRRDHSQRRRRPTRRACAWQEIDAREELVALRAQGKQNESTREQELAKKNEELREASLYQDRCGGASRPAAGSRRVGDRFVIRWANKLTSELACTRKRYDLEKYVGFEIGVTGVTQRASAGSASGVGRRAAHRGALGGGRAALSGHGERATALVAQARGGAPAHVRALEQALSLRLVQVGLRQRVRASERPNAPEMPDYKRK